MIAEFTDDEFKIVVRSLTRSIYELQSSYRRNVNSNHTFAASVLEQIKAYAALYTRLSGCVFVFDWKSLQDSVYGQLKLELI
mgnify:CR=1 FL=1